MSLPAADELFQIRNDNSQLRRRYKYMKIALVIAATGLVMNTLPKLEKNMGMDMDMDFSAGVVSTSCRSWSQGSCEWGSAKFRRLTLLGDEYASP